MASSDTPANPDEGDEQAPSPILPVSKSKSTPPSSESATNKRKRESSAANVNINEETKPPAKELAKDTEGEKHVKEVEMKDAEVAYNKQPDMEEKSVKENETASDLNASTGGCKGKVIEISENRNEKQTNNDDEDGSGSGEHVLGEVATLLKQVQQSQSDTEAKLQVEVKVKKMDHIKENDQVNKEDGQTAGRVSGP